MTYDAALQSLQKRWAFAVFGYALGFVGLGIFLLLHLSLYQTLLWLGMSGIIGFYILGYLYTRLPENIRPGDLDLLPGFGPGTVLSLIGGWLLAAMGGFLLIPWPTGGLAWLPALLFLAALMADLFDGVLARRANHVTRLGQDLDMTLDGLGVLLAAMLAVRWGQWPLWYVIVGLARYLFVWGLAWRKRKGLPTRELEDSVTRRLLAGLQRGFLFVTLWPIMPAWLATTAGLAVVLPFIILFTYDWLVASTVIDDSDPDFRAALARWQRLAYGPVALAVRLLTAAMTAVTLWEAFSAQEAFAAGLMQIAGLPAVTAPVLLSVGAILALLLALGVLPRLTAVLLYIPISFILAADVSFWPGFIAFFGLTLVILLGPGPYALVQPEAGVFTKRPGSWRNQG